MSLEERSATALLVLSLLGLAGLAGCGGGSTDTAADPAQPAGPVGAAAPAGPTSSGAPPQRAARLIEYAAVVTSPGIGTYRQIPEHTDQTRRECHWCRTSKHDSCDGKIYFGPRVEDRDVAYLPEVSFPCGCSIACYRNR